MKNFACETFRFACEIPAPPGGPNAAPSSFARKIPLSAIKGAACAEAATVSDAQSEKRRESRRRVFRGATISFRGHSAAIDCVIRDISSAGARLAVESAIGVPDRFYLVVEGEPVRACRIVWRRARLLGVEFVDPPSAASPD